MTIIGEGIVCLCGLALLAFPAALRTVEVAETQRPIYQAELIGFSGNSVKIQQLGRTREIPLENLLGLRFVDSSAVQSKTESPLEVELRGGSRVMASNVTSDGKQVTIASHHGPITLPSKAVNSCKFRRLNPQLLQQWKTLVESQVASDMLVLVRSDDALDKIEGLIAKVTSEVVFFEVDGQTVEAPRAKLAGMKYFSADTDAIGPLAGVVRDIHQNQWLVASISSEDDRCSLKLTCGESVELPLSDLSELDLSYGNMRYVAALEPLERTSNSRFELGIALPDSAKLFGARSIQTTSKSGLQGPSVEFVGAGSATYRVPAGFTKLVGAVELKPGGHAFVPCRAAVLLENKVLWEHTFEATRQPQEIALIVGSDKRLRLVVESKVDHPLGDIMVWNQLRFMK